MAHQQPPSQPRAYNLPNGGPQVSGPVPGARPLEPNQGRVQQIGHARVLCVADVRGNLRQLNELARNAKADYILHTGDFGFYDDASLDRIAEKTLKHVAQYSPLLDEATKADIARSAPQQSIKDRFQREHLPLSELPSFLNKTYKLDVPVYTVWGACEDVAVLEKLRSSEYKIDNLHVIDESHSRLLDVGGVKLRLLGLGGAVVMHKMFDNGEGRTTIAGGQGTMWTTLLQIGELIDTANRVYDPTETRVLVTHASPAREGLLNQLSVALKADFSISAGLHFRYGSSYNEFSVNPSLDHYRGKLSASKAQFNDVWETVKHEVEPAVSENESQNKLLQLALDLVQKMPTSAGSGGNPFGGGVPQNGQVDESAFKNMWNFNLADAAFGWLVLDIDQGRIGTEMRAQGFNFSHRGSKTQGQQRPPQAPANSSMAPTGGNLPTPAQQPPPVAQQQAPRPPQGPAATQQRAQQPQATQSKPTPPQQASAQSAPKATGTPQPATAALTANGTTAPVTNLPTNGTAQTNGTPAPASETPKPDSTPARNNAHPAQSPSAPPSEPSKSIFITPAQPSTINSSDDVKALFSSEDAAKITSIESRAKGQWIAHYDSRETMMDVLTRNRNSELLKEKGARLAEFRNNHAHGNFNRGGGGAGSWGSRGGYQSASGATTGSDSETNRGGRGGGRGGRGAFRGEGGRGRGRGGRGGAGKPDGAAPASGGDS